MTDLIDSVIKINQRGHYDLQTVSVSLREIIACASKEQIVELNKLTNDKLNQNSKQSVIEDKLSKIKEIVRRHKYLYCPMCKEDVRISVSLDKCPECGITIEYHDYCNGIYIEEIKKILKE